MKKIKVLTGLVGLTGLSMGLMPVISSCNKNAINVEISETVKTKGVTVKTATIIKDQNSTIEFVLPDGKTLKSVDITVGGETVSSADITINSPKITIAATAMKDTKVVVNDVTFITPEPTPTEPKVIIDSSVASQFNESTINKTDTLWEITLNLKDTTKEVVGVDLSIGGTAISASDFSYNKAGQFVTITKAKIAEHSGDITVMPTIQAKIEPFELTRTGESLYQWEDYSAEKDPYKVYNFKITLNDGDSIDSFSFSNWGSMTTSKIISLQIKNGESIKKWWPDEITSHLIHCETISSGTIEIRAEFSVGLCGIYASKAS